MARSPLLATVDHLVYATTDLDQSIADLGELMGVRAASGGVHPGRGTRNALIALSDTFYLEIIGPDPEQPRSAAPRWFGIDTIATPGLVAWAAKGTELAKFAAEVAQRGVHLGRVGSGSRQGSNGAVLRWEFTDPGTVVADGLVPFFIDWGESPHPAASAPRGPSLVTLRGQHPQPALVEGALAAVGIDLPVERGPRPMLIATLKAGRGPIELR